MEVPLIAASVLFWAHICAEPPDMKGSAYNSFDQSSENGPGWTAIDSLIAQINPSVSALFPLNFSGSATFMVFVEEEELGEAGMVNC